MIENNRSNAHFYGQESIDSFHKNLDILPIDIFKDELIKAGFDVDGEIDRKGKLKYKFGREKGDLIWVGGITDEVVEHAFEYSKKDIVRVPPSYEIVNNKLFSSRFVAYAEEITSPSERKGSVLRGLKKLEDKLSNSPEGSFVIWTSPDGSLGIGDMEYDYSWTHIFFKQGDKARYVSIRTDFTINEHASFLNFFLPVEQQINNKKFTNSLEDIQKIVETPVVVTTQSDIKNLSEIAEVMSKIRGNAGNIAYIDKQDGRKRYFGEIINELSFIDQKQQTEREEIQGLIDHYEGMLLQEGLSKDDEARIIGQYLLAVNYIFKNNLHKNHDFYKMDYSLLAGFAYKKGMMKDLQEIKGCAGGLRQNTSTFTNHKSEKSFSGECPVCGNFVVELHVGERCTGCNTQYLCAEE